MSDKDRFARDRAPEPIIAAYREKLLYVLAIIGATVVAPFSLLNFAKGYLFVGAVTMTVVLIFVVDALAIYRKRPLPVPVPVAFSGVICTLGVAIEERGLLGIFWTFPALLLFHFVLERRLANLFNFSLVAVVAVVAFRTLESDVALRIAVGQLLTIAFTNIFSYVVEAEQRKETEQRRRLGLLVRATRAGFYQWDRGSAAVTYSGRLKEMLGYDPDADTSNWPPFPDLVHPEDREQRYRLFQAGARDRSVRDGVRRHVAGDFRMFRANGETIWVHSEGLFIHDARGVATRYIASLIDVTERYRQEADLRRSNNQIGVQAQQLRDQNDALRSAIRVREEVERIARHDLRTPLNSILAVPRLLREESRRRDGRPVGAREEELLGMIEGAAYRILDLVNLSVDLYRMEQGEYRFSPRVVDLVGLAETVTREVRAHADTKGVRIEMRVDGEAAGAQRRAFAWAEELLCYSVIANLLKNAVEASPDGGVVTLSFDTRGAQVVLAMHNAGVVPDSVRRSFFEKYATYGKVGGFGLGTYSARLMARVQQGELSMRTSEADGTVLELRLPVLPPGASSALVGARGSGVPAAAREERLLPRLRVLVVDDDEFNLAFVRDALPAPPLEVATAINGRAAVDAVRAAPPDVVFMDIEMPVMNGFDAIAQIRALEKQAGRKPAVVVAFSSYDDEAMRRRCRDVGFDAYLSKPAARERIHEILHAVAAGRKVPDSVAVAAPAGGNAGPEAAVDVDPDLRASLPRFFATRGALLDELRAALAAGERDAAARIAHKLAGAFALYRFAWAAAESRALQRDAAGAGLDDLERRCEALRRHLEQVRLKHVVNAPGPHERTQEAAAD
jgi:PAS domain S-box-containing protein